MIDEPLLQWLYVKVASDVTTSAAMTLLSLKLKGGEAVSLGTDGLPFSIATHCQLINARSN